MSFKTPNISRSEIETILSEHGIYETVALIGIRGYYLDSMGKPAVNDRGIYDDAIILIAPNNFQTFQANVDPSIYRKGIASLKAGKYRAVKWMHRGKYKSLQIVEDVVLRDGDRAEDKGRHGINIHYGGEEQTWSEGCQTLPQSIYWELMLIVYRLMDAYKLNTIPYLLIEKK